MTHLEKRARAKLNQAKLIDFLMSNGISPIEFAEVVGVTKGAVKHWVNGIRDIPPVYMKLINAFEADKLDMWEFMRL